jgi:hypothetical protein
VAGIELPNHSGIVLDAEFYQYKVDLIIKFIEEGRTEAALHMLRQHRTKFDQISEPTTATIHPF